MRTTPTGSLTSALPFVVKFGETGEEREARRYCRVCYPCPLNDDVMLVSPSGVVHHSDEWGTTLCGKDATRLNWWWKS